MARWSLLLSLALGACAPPPLDDKDTGTVDSDSDALVDSRDTSLLDTGVLGDTGLLVNWPTDPAKYVFDNATYLRRIVIPPLSGAEACCEDFGSISRTPGVDNAVASLNTLLSGFPGGGLNLNDELAGVIESGQFVALLDHRDLPATDGEYKLGLLFGRFQADTTYSRAADGTGTFEVLPTSFEPGSGRPLVVFREARRVGNRIEASGGNFLFSLGIQNVTLALPVDEVTVSAGLVTDANGFAVSDGKLSGWVEVDSFFDAYNEVVAESCGCAEPLIGKGPLFTKAGNTWTGDCQLHQDDPSTADVTEIGVLDVCTEVGQGVCENLIGNDLTLGGLCQQITDFVPLIADLDIDGDSSTYEALSVGLRIEGAPARVVGLALDEAP